MALTVSNSTFQIDLLKLQVQKYLHNIRSYTKLVLPHLEHCCESTVKLWSRQKEMKFALLDPVPFNVIWQIFDKEQQGNVSRLQITSSMLVFEDPHGFQTRDLKCNLTNSMGLKPVVFKSTEPPETTYLNEKLLTDYRVLHIYLPPFWWLAISKAVDLGKSYIPL